MGLQAVASDSLSMIASYLEVGYAFGAGMVSAVNPCGFVMLPVYLALYVGAGEQNYGERSLLLRVLRSLGVASLVTLGFALLFGLVGGIVAYGGSFLLSYTPWLALAVGAFLVLLACWLFLGKTISLPWLQNFAGKIGDPRQVSATGFFLFGLAYGATSTSCTLPIFLAVVMNSVATGNPAAALGQFAIYIAGVFTVIALLTMGMALLKRGVVEQFFRRWLPYVHRISAIFLLIAGLYIIYYWLTSGLLGQSY